MDPQANLTRTNDIKHLTETSTQNYVVEIYSQTFKSKVLDSPIDVLIQFTAPWCTVCHILDPIYEHLARLMREEDVSVFKYDCGTSESPEGFNIPAFPTLFFIRSDRKSIHKKYYGPIDVQELLNFVCKNASKPLKNFDEKGKTRAAERTGEESIGK